MIIINSTFNHFDKIRYHFEKENYFIIFFNSSFSSFKIL